MKKKVFNKKSITDWKFILMLLGILLVGVSVFILNQKLTYQSSAKDIEQDAMDQYDLEEQFKDAFNDYQDNLDNQTNIGNTNNYNTGTVPTSDGGFCTLQYCYDSQGNRTPRENYLDELKEDQKAIDKKANNIIKKWRDLRD